MWFGEIDGNVGYFPRADITRSSKNIIITDVCVFFSNLFYLKLFTFLF